MAADWPIARNECVACFGVPRRGNRVGVALEGPGRAGPDVRFVVDNQDGKSLVAHTPSSGIRSRTCTTAVRLRTNASSNVARTIAAVIGMRSGVSEERMLYISGGSSGSCLAQFPDWCSDQESCTFHGSFLEPLLLYEWASGPTSSPGVIAGPVVSPLRSDAMEFRECLAEIIDTPYGSLGAPRIRPGRTNHLQVDEGGQGARC